MPSPKETFGEPSIFLTVWDEAWQAIRSPRRYVAWAFQPLSRSISYLALMCVLASIIWTAYFFLSFAPPLRQAALWAEENIPEVRVEDGLLSIEGGRTYTFSDNDRVFIRIDASEFLEDASIDAFYEEGLIVARDGILLRNNGRTTSTTFEEAGVTSLAFDGQSVRNFIQGFLRFAPLLVPAVLFVYLWGSKLLITALYSFLFSLFSGFRLTFKSVWSMAMYAQTPAMLASYLLFVFYPIPLAGTFVFLFYLSLAITHYLKFLQFRKSINH